MEAKTPLEKYVAAGKEFTEASLKRAQIIIRDLAREGENSREHAEGWADDFVQRAEGFTEIVRNEIARQVKALNLATNQDVIKLVQQFVERTTGAAAPTREPASRPTQTADANANAATAAARTASKKATAAKKTAPARKTAPAKKAAARKTAPAKKTATRTTKTVAKKAAPASEPVAKRAAPAKKTVTADKAPANAQRSTSTAS